MQKRIVDLAADVSFGEAARKVEEHYNIEVPVTSIQRITKAHAERASDRLECLVEAAARDENVDSGLGVTVLIAETDGTMVPIVSFSEDAKQQGNDRRKQRQTCWMEAKLCLAGQPDAVARTFAATLGNPDSAGDCLYYCAVREGHSFDTMVHCVADGAPWIASQVDRVFGTHGSFLVDFYHVTEYLANAAKFCATGAEKEWIHSQQSDLKQGKLQNVLSRLIIQPDTVDYCDIDDNPVRKCYRYLLARHDQLNYKRAIEHGLPIGSGEIESAHRTVIQRRLKIPGAWWLPDTAHNMLALRCLRANGDWSGYWRDYVEELEAA